MTFVQVRIDDLADLAAVHGDLVADAVLGDVLGVIRSTTARDADVSQQPGGELLLFFIDYTDEAPDLEHRLSALLGAIEELTPSVHGGDSDGSPRARTSPPAPAVLGSPTTVSRSKPSSPRRVRRNAVQDDPAGRGG